MDSSNIPSNGSLETGTEDYTGHWQPAFRPDVLQSGNATTPTHSIDSQPPFSFTDHDEPPDHHKVDSIMSSSIPMPDPRPVISPPVSSGPYSRRRPELSTIEEQASASYPQVKHEENKTIPPSSLQDQLKSPLVGISWSRGRIGDADAEMSSDEDTERLDPAWGIKRMDSTQILQSVNRSSSFPDFGPQAPFSASSEVQLTHSQAEQMMEEDENDAAEEDVYGANEEKDVDIQDESENDAEEEPLLEIANHSRSEAVGTENVLPVPPAEDEQHESEARFEEGVPLLSPEAKPATISADKALSLDASDDIFGASEVEEGTSFFDHINPVSSSQQSKPPPLDRKTTSDVLESINFSPDGPMDSPVRTDPFEQLQTGGAEEFDFSQMQTGETPQPDDADAMWKAALADDEFLVEDPDDLLPESPPDSPSSFFGSSNAQNAPQNEQPAPATTPKRDSRPGFARHSSSNPYAPHQPSTSDLTQLSPTTYSTVGLTRPGLAPMNSFQQHLQQRPAPIHSAQSFVDQSKGGYKSPYDLPLELSKPRKRVQAPLPSPSLKGVPPPPPRSSSMSSDLQLQSPFTPTNTSFPSLARVASTQAPAAPASRNTPIASPPQPSSKPRTGSSSFFEELPITSRPRPPTGQGRYTPQQNTSMPPPQLLPRSPPSRQGSMTQPVASPPRTVADPYAQYQLRPPERLDPYANVPLQVPGPSIPTASTTRYSPAPPTSQLGPRPSPSSRYSPAPPPQPTGPPAPSRYASQPVQSTEPPMGTVAGSGRYASQPPTNPPPSAVQPFQPRTSSPLAYHGRSINDPSKQAPVSAERNISISQLSDTNPLARSQGLPTPGTNLPRSGVATSSPPRAAFLPPKRSQTQSPGKRGPVSSFPILSNDGLHRPASVHSQVPPVNAFSPLETFPPQRPNVRPRGLTQTFNFIEPNDGQQLDELQRWKGAPIFRFGFGGSIISSFPKHIPRYGAGMSTPMIKPSAGEVVLRSAKDVLPLPELIASFPGPLRSKSKKKDLLAWLTSYITALENAHLTGAASRQLPNQQRRHDEKVLLWKIVRALVEHDGVLEIGTEPRKAVNSILTPDLVATEDSTMTQYRDSSDLTGIYRPAGAISRSDAVDPVAVENLRQNLLRGEREKAVWAAVDNRLWAHALLISSTLDRAVWKQVVQEFVRQEVKSIGANTESLAAVYEIFAGNLEESIDELVPPSARAGLQMVSKVDSAGPTKNALDGLDRWRETLSLVLNNRSPDDTQALAALGRLLASYGRVEAAHICFIFSRGPTLPNIFGGADDPQSNVVLLGADHQAQPQTFFRDEDAVILTEVYEFATSILANATLSSSLPHLQVYKLHRAFSLAESDRKAEAQAYCEGIAGSLKSNTRMSPYFHPIFFTELDELSNRLRQAPVQGSSSWIAKPSIEKVSGSVWNKFSSFVAGDDSDAESKGSGKDANHEFGPFAKISGTPSISRSGSQTDLYGSYPTNTPQAVPNTIAGSRYAPNGMQTARSSSELTRGRPSLDSQRSPPATAIGQGQRSGSFEPASSFVPQGYQLQGTNMYQSLSQSPPTTRYQATPPQTSYIANNMLQDSPQRHYSAQQPTTYIPTPPPEQVLSSYVPTPPPADYMATSGERPSFGGYSPAIPADNENEYIPDQPGPSYETSYEPTTQSYSYEPPADTGYVPYQPEPESEPESDETKSKAPKKKSFMDDDDDFPRVSNGISKGQTPAVSNAQPSSEDDAAARKRANDAAADAAFRAAAEADAARAKEKSGSLKSKPSGWAIGGWFGKKSDSLDASSSSSKGGEAKVHRAHLGESKMTFHFDKELNKWVDPSNPDNLKEKSATPPPPRMGPRGLTPSASMPVLPSGAGSRPPSGPRSTGPPSGPPSRVGTPGDGPLPPASGLPPNMQRPPSSGLSGPPSGTGTPPPPGMGGLAPPSRPATGMSNASSIDDLLGPPGGTTGGRRTVKGKKGTKRYVDVMAQ